MITWRCRCPKKSLSWSPSAEEDLSRTPAACGCCQTGSGWRDESPSRHRTRCPPTKHAQTRDSAPNVLLFFFSSLPSTFAAPQSVEDVVASNGADVTPCSIYSRQRTSAAVEDVTYNRRAPRRQDFPEFPSGNIHKPHKPDQCNHNRNRPRIQTEVQERRNTLKVKLSRA